jgi:hypothetical protein
MSSTLISERDRMVVLDTLVRRKFRQAITDGEEIRR